MDGEEEITAMSPSVLPDSSYTATRLTIATSASFGEFEARFERAIPQAVGVLSVLAACPAPWADVVAMTAEAAPTHGFFIYLKAPVDRLMRIAGHQTRTCSYLIGNHVMAERMYRHSPAITLHSPLRVVLWEDKNGLAMLTFDHPGAQFSCFDDPEIAAVGIEINAKFAELLVHLQLPVPESLKAQ
jgi:uncharacterized protein (DUF302 family)